MPKEDPHAVSMRTRREVERVLYDKHKLDPGILVRYGTLEDIMKGYKLFKGGKVSLGSRSDPFKTRSNRWIVGTDVMSGTTDGQTYFVGVMLETEMDDVFYGKQEGNRAYKITGAGDQYMFQDRPVSAHTCKGMFFQAGMKKLPVKCKHCVAASLFVPKELNRAREDAGHKWHGIVQGVEVAEMYHMDLEGIEKLYDELGKHTLTAAQRLDLLYRYAEGEAVVKGYGTGKGFRKSVGL